MDYSWSVWKTEQIGWIGTGVMGQSMAGHLIKAGGSLWVYNRTPEKAASLIKMGAKWVNSPKEMARECGLIFTMVGFPKDIEEVYWGENGIFAGVKPGTTLIDMTSTSPTLAQRIFIDASRLGAQAIDAPVTGGDVGARNATLSILCGGKPEVVEQVRPVLEWMGKNIIYQGPAGSGQHAKIANQLVVAGTMIGVCEALVYAGKAGLNLDAVLASIRPGAAGCWTLDNLAPRIIQGNFEPGFYVDHFVKDLGLALSECEKMGITLPGLTLAHRLYREVQNQGMGNKGTHSLYMVLSNWKES